jgi:predicted permease
VVSEVALALVAIIGAGLFAKSFQMARQINPGFDPRGVVVSHVSLAQLGYSVPDRIQFCARLRERLESQPGVKAVSYADYIPLGIGDGSWEDLKIEGYVPARSESMKIYRTVAAPGYLNVIGIHLLDGRDFTEQDDRKSMPAMIVNRTFVQRFFGGRYAIGRRVHGWGQWFTIVGVASDAKFYQPNESQRPLFYVPFRQVYREDLPIALYVKTTGNPNAAINMMRQEVHSMDAGVGLFDAMPLSEYIGASLFAQKMAAALLGALGVIALILAAAGLYSVMAYSITQRTQEIGIRMALGAKPGDVIGLVIRQGLRLTVAGLLAGVGLAIAVTRVASGLLVNVSATDPLIFAGAALFLAAVALAASYLPARRATRIDPNVALRCQ